MTLTVHCICCVVLVQWLAWCVRGIGYLDFELSFCMCFWSCVDIRQIIKLSIDSLK